MQGRSQMFCSMETKERSLTCSLSQVTARRVKQLMDSLGMARRLVWNLKRLSHCVD